MKNDRQIKAIIKTKKEGKHPVGNNLYLRISKEQTVTWVVRYTINGKRKEITIGGYPDVTLRNASLEADDIKKNARKGVDPQCSDEDDISTVDDLAYQWIAHKKNNIKTWTINERVYRRDISPAIGLKTINNVTPLNIKSLIEKAAVPGRMSVANTALQFCKEIFDYGIRLGVAESNPARSFTVKDAGGIGKKRARALSIKELPEVFKTLRDNQVHFSRDNYLYCALLLALSVRKGELIIAKIEEFDMVNDQWILPNERIKQMEKTTKKRPVYIPLEPEVKEWINELRYRAGSSEYLFPTRRTSKNSPHACTNTLNHAIASMFKNKRFPSHIQHFTVHDLRRTSRTLLSKIGVEPWVAERCLGHAIPGIEGTYNVDDYFQKRREGQRKLLDLIAPIINDK
ncbi:tyrosine-type recombinase/integrase [Candidatus Sororendozoicomonas aggregata]|uniref:tyrosine-type recombinase/integrase n=1 Tax=Candidatus Sororendozoicomonas aggregata TaxID=3073239 RepID=UPI002ED008B5